MRRRTITRLALLWTLLAGLDGEGFLGSAYALVDDPDTSRTQPGNALVMPFDVSDGHVSFLTASNIGSTSVSTHWVFWSENCSHLVDVFLCLTPNDTTVVDPTSFSAIDLDNEPVGPEVNLSGSRGFVVVTAYEADDRCLPTKTPVDDALVGAFTFARTASSAAFGNDALTLGLDETDTYTALPARPRQSLLTLHVSTLDPENLDFGFVGLMALRERAGVLGDDAEIGPNRVAIASDLLFYDRNEIPTSLRQFLFRCAAFASVLPEDNDLLPSTFQAGSSGILELQNLPVGGPPGDRTWVTGFYGAAIGAFGVSHSAKTEPVLPAPQPTPAG